MGKIRQPHRQPHSLIKTRRLSLSTLCAFSLLLLAQLTTANEIHPEAASGMQPVKTARSTEWMAVTANAYATDAAGQIITLGGSAVDAAIAAQLVLGLVEPQSSGIGGGGFMVHWQASNQVLQTYDGRETAPKNVRKDHFMVQQQPMGFFDAVVGGHSVGVPGLVAMLYQAHQTHGKLPWAQLFDPAITLAEQGFPLSPRLHALLAYLARAPMANSHDTLQNYFYQASGQPKPVGTVLKNPAYAKTLRLIAKQGPTVFYQGQIAQDIVNAVRNDAVKPGLLSLDDMKGYQSLNQQAVCSIITSYKFCGAAPPSSGPLAVIQILTMLQDLPGYLGLGYESPGFYHRLIEASKLAFADRNTYIADPKFVNQPVSELLAPGYLKQRAQGIPLLKASTVPAQPGHISGYAYKMADSPELPSTTHLSIIDTEGNVVSMTTSIETAFGSRIMVDGFLLNNQLTDFSFRPDQNGQSIANRPQGGKRPRSSMSPMIVFDTNGKPVLVIGSPGGSRIIDYVAKTIAQHLFLKAPLEKAIASPQVTNINKGSTEVEKGTPISQPLAKALEKIGHTVKLGHQTSGISAIAIQHGNYIGVADPRREGTAMGAASADVQSAPVSMETLDTMQSVGDH